MKTRTFNPLRLDVQAFAEAEVGLSGEWLLPELPRLADSGLTGSPALHTGRVKWSARGRCRQRSGASPAWFIDLEASVQMPLQCQRCLQPVETDIEVAHPLRFVADEAQAAALDAESDEDVLALSRALDLRALVEDELLLALPLVPRHEACPTPASTSASGEDIVERPNPFAALAVLKKSDPTH